MGGVLEIICALCIEQNLTDDGSYDLPKHAGDLLTSDVYSVW